MGQRIRSRKDGKSKGTAVKNYNVNYTSGATSGSKKKKRRKKS